MLYCGHDCFNWSTAVGENMKLIHQKQARILLKIRKIDLGRLPVSLDFRSLGLNINHGEWWWAEKPEK